MSGFWLSERRNVMLLRKTPTNTIATVIGMSIHHFNCGSSKRSPADMLFRMIEIDGNEVPIGLTEFVVWYVQVHRNRPAYNEYLTSTRLKKFGKCFFITEFLFTF